MNPVLDGGCPCGRVRYRIEAEPLGLAVCHCRGCQRQSGSAFGMRIELPWVSIPDGARGFPDDG